MPWNMLNLFDFYSRPVLAIRYCRCLCLLECLCMCVWGSSVCQSVCQSLACPRDNSGPVQARITKFGPKMQKNLVQVPIVLGGNWPWPSRSNLTWKSEFTPFSACPHHKSLPIQARIAKFRPEVQNSLVKIPIINCFGWQLTVTFKVKFDLKSQIFWSHHYWKYITTIFSVVCWVINAS